MQNAIIIGTTESPPPYCTAECHYSLRLLPPPPSAPAHYCPGAERVTSQPPAVLPVGCARAGAIRLTRGHANVNSSAAVLVHIRDVLESNALLRGASGGDDERARARATSKRMLEQEGVRARAILVRNCDIYAAPGRFSRRASSSGNLAFSDAELEPRDVLCAALPQQLLLCAARGCAFVLGVSIFGGSAVS